MSRPLLMVLIKVFAAGLLALFGAWWWAVALALIWVLPWLAVV